MLKAVKGALDVEYVALGNVSVTFGCADTGMAEKGLDVTDTGAVFK